MEDALALIKNEYSELPLIVCGDLNINNLEETWDKECLYDVLNSSNLNVTFKKGTRVNENTNKSSQLDYLITDLHNSSYTVEILPPMLSDHSVIFFKLNVSCPKIKKKIERRKINKSNLDLFETLLRKQEWQGKYVNSSVNEIFNDFYTTFLYLFEVCFPKAIFNIKDDSHVKWMTAEIIESQEELKELYWRTRTSNNIKAKSDYSRAKTQYSTLVSNTKKQYYRHKLDNANNISKESWSIVRNLTCDDNVYSCNLSLYINDELITQPSSVANYFNNYFVTEIIKLTGAQPVSVSQPELCHIVPAGCFTLWPTSEKEVAEIMQKVSSKNSAGVDDVPCNILRVCKDIIAKPLAKIINKSFEQGCFPSRLKTSKVVPVHKGKEKNLVKNFRPVAVQSVFSKIIEIIFLKRLIPYLDSKKILSSHQYGFRKGTSTTDAVFDLLVNLYDNLDAIGEQLCVFYDMTKAFDLLSHSVLKEKLISMGIRGRPLEWISSYLQDRYQVVNVRHTSHLGLTRNYWSSVSPAINTGVPQGSNLGPVLFLLYVNDLPESISTGKIWLFADDVSHLVHGEDRQILRDVAQEGLDEVSGWCKQNKLLLNKGKTKALQFYNRRQPDSAPLLRLDGTSISVDSSVKYLGLTLSEDLRWQQHIENVSARLTAVCYMVSRLKHVVDKEVLMKVYYGCFHSIMSYGIVFWGSSPLAQRILLLQKRIIRTISNESYLAHCKPLFVNLKVLTMTSLFILESAVMVKKKPEIFTKNENLHRYDTRQKSKIHVTQVASSLAKSGPRFMAGQIYNKLPPEIRSIEDVNKFKNNLKEFLMMRPFYLVEEYLECKE